MSKAPVYDLAGKDDSQSVVMHTADHAEQTYTIPLRYRKMENLHIVFWLFKDISWCMIWQTLGIIMVIPTLSVAIYIAYRTREIKSE